jgi:hypothetical protein
MLFQAWAAVVFMGLVALALALGMLILIGFFVAIKKYLG